jgi:hypothetical protein
MSIENLESSIRPLITTESGTDLCGVVLQNDEQLRVSHFLFAELRVRLRMRSSSIRPLIAMKLRWGTDLCGVVLQNDEQLRVSPLRPFAPSERPSVEMTLVF